MNCVVCGKEHNFPRRTTCGILCWRKVKPIEYRKKLSGEAADRLRRNASRKYPCFTCLRFLGVKNSEIAKSHGVDSRIVSFAVVDNLPKRISKADKFQCGLCLRLVGLGAVRVNRLLPVVSKCEWSVIFKKAGLQDLPMIKFNPSGYPIDHLTKYEKRLYRSGLELNAWFPDWDVAMITRELMRETGLTYEGARYNVMIHGGRKKSAANARRIHKDKKNESVYKTKAALRNTLTRMKRNGFQKNRRSNRYLGCTYADAMRHIERQFKKGMTWANHGKVWHIDHIVPLASFDLSNDDHVLMCCHYTNLQPMWASDNIRKGDTVPVCQPQLALAY